MVDVLLLGKASVPRRAREGVGVSGKGQDWERSCSAGREHENPQNPSMIAGEVRKMQKAVRDGNEREREQG